MKTPVNVNQFKIEAPHRAFVAKRVHDLVRWWGMFIGTYSIEDLAASCYTQGLLDAQQLYEKQKKVNI